MSFRLYSSGSRRRSTLGLISSFFPITGIAVAPFIGFALMCLAFVGLLVSFIVFSSPLSANKAERQTLGYYSLTSPLLISTAPKVVITKGRLRFFDGTEKKDRDTLLGGLPFNWINTFLSKKLSHIHLSNAQISIDFRGIQNTTGKTEDAKDAIEVLSFALKESKLEHFKISNSKLKVLRTYGTPLELILKQGEFEIDLADHEIEGSGQFTVKDTGKDSGTKITEFSFSHDFSSQNKKGIVLNAISLSLKNNHFSSKLDGVLEGRSGLHFKGTASLELKDINHSPLSFSKSVPSKAIPFKAEGFNWPFKAAGSLIWSDNEGTLSDSQFTFGRNIANGTVSLKLGQANPEVTGTLAFETLDFSKFHHSKLQKMAVLKQEDPPADNGAFIRTINTIIPLVRNYDADVRLSADQIKLGDLLLEEAGFSVFQKNGELLIDMAGLTLLDGSATGLIKVDTKSPKPRWHINLGFKNINLSKMEDVFPHSSFFDGVGHLKLMLTSFGDKGDEIHENMFGSLNFTLPKGGKLALDLNHFIGEQENNSEQTVKGLKSGKSSFDYLNSFAHFSKGSVIFDHFMISTKDYDFTGRGFLNLQSQAMNWHVASWETTELKKDAATPDAPQAGVVDPQTSETEDPARKNLNGHSLKAPLLLTCSHIKGFWDALSFEKYTALHLSLLNKACPAFYHYDQLKTKDHPIVR